MEINNPFDQKLDAQINWVPEEVSGSLVHLVDSLDLCWAGARAVFMNEARPEHALALLQLLEARLLSKQPAPESARERRGRLRGDEP